MGVMASGVEYRVGAPDIVAAQFPPILVASHVVLTPEKVQRGFLKGSRVCHLGFDRERVLRRHSFEDCLVRSAKTRKDIPGKCLQRGLTLDDGHFLVVLPHVASQSQDRRVLPDNLPAGKAASLMGRLVHARKSSQAKNLIPKHVGYVPGNHASERIADYCERPVSKTLMDIVQSALRDVVCAGDIRVSVSRGPR